MTDRIHPDRVDLGSGEDTAAAWIAKFLQRRGVEVVFGLQGGHIQPIWDWLGRLGIRIVDVRDEGAAVHMAHAHAELTGRLGVAMVTAGPGVTNCVTAIANASLARAPVLLIGGCPPTFQVNMGPLQDIPHAEIMRPVTRQSRTLRVAEQILREFDEAVARAFGDLGEPGPVYLEIPTDVLRQDVPTALAMEEWLAAKPKRVMPPDPVGVQQAAAALRAARRPLVLTGRGARDAGPALVRFIDATGAVYLDTQESRGLVPQDHPSFAGAVRGHAMNQADLVVVVGRKLDYQTGYGSPAVFPDARFIRISDTAGELVDNRRGAPELLATPSLALDAIVADLGDSGRNSLDTDWTDDLARRQKQRAAGGFGDTPEVGPDGKLHPRCIFDAIAAADPQDYIAVADGGDLLSFARIGLAPARTYLDAGAFGCLGVGVPFAIAAALACPDRPVISVNGDGAYGINAMEVDTAVRHGAKAVFIVSNNAAWNIERYDQEANYAGRVVGTTLRHSDYAAMARALGAHGERVEKPEDMLPALKRALQNAPAVIDVVTSREAVSSDANKGLGFVPNYQALTAWDEAEQRRRGLV
ncbi:MAG: thiamine pyrophosphate-binding protein [Alphaproteobacteria bacterium]|nr:thiamine pyrophosphate-binding protein [Alphaproteobacteria bacterium]